MQLVCLTLGIVQVAVGCLCKTATQLRYPCSSEDMAAQLCELEATAATVSTRLEQLMVHNDQLVEEKGLLQAQVGGRRGAHGWNGHGSCGRSILKCGKAGPSNSWQSPFRTPIRPECQRLAVVFFALQVRDLQLRAQNAGQAADSSKAQVAALRKERAELVQQAQSLAAQLAERDVQLQALSKTNCELRCAGKLLAVGCFGSVHLVQAQRPLRCTSLQLA